MIEISTIETPIGLIEITADTNFVKSIQFIKEKKAVFVNYNNDIINQTNNELTEYFNGNRTIFTLPLTFTISPFYKKVLLEVQKIKYGQTASYGYIAKVIGQKGASRAVGKANSKNPIVEKMAYPAHFRFRQGSFGTCKSIPLHEPPVFKKFFFVLFRWNDSEPRAKES